MRQKANFIVVDTEGKNELNEIAVIDSQGKLIFDGSIIGRIAQNKVVLENPSPSEYKQILQT